MLVNFLLIIKKEDYRLETDRLNLLKFLTYLSRIQLPILYREIFNKFIALNRLTDELDLIFKNMLISYNQNKEIYLFFVKILELVTGDSKIFISDIDIGFLQKITIYKQFNCYTFQLYNNQIDILNNIDQTIEVLNGYTIFSEYTLLKDNIKLFTDTILGYIYFDTREVKYGNGIICVIKNNNILTFKLFNKQINTNFKLYLEKFIIKTTGSLIEKTFTCPFNDPLSQHLLTKIKYENPFGRDLLDDYIYLKHNYFFVNTVKRTICIGYKNINIKIISNNVDDFKYYISNLLIETKGSFDGDSFICNEHDPLAIYFIN